MEVPATSASVCGASALAFGFAGSATEPVALRQDPQAWSLKRAIKIQSTSTRHAVFGSGSEHEPTQSGVPRQIPTCAKQNILL